MILVTGGAGFIGSGIVAGLCGDGWDVIALDDLSSGDPANLPEGVPLVEADISEPGVTETIASLRPGAVIHAAAQVSVAASAADPDRDRAVNVEGTENVISGAAAAGAGRLVFVSSGGAIYGECDGASETTPPNPESYYGAHKYLAERYVELSGLSYAIARLSNVYGPGQRFDLEGGVVAILLDRLHSGEPVTINGPGTQSRDFIHLHDVVSAILAMLNDSSNATYNVATGRSTTILELLRNLETHANPATKVSHDKPRPGDVKRSRLDPAKLSENLGWYPKYDLDSGLKQTAHTTKSTQYNA